MEMFMGRKVNDQSRRGRQKIQIIEWHLVDHIPLPRPNSPL